MSKTILVTGAAGGIGGTFARHAAGRGHRVIAAYHPDMPPAEAPAGAGLLPMDIGSTASVARAFGDLDALLGAGGRLDTVVHCAALAPFGTAEFSSADDLVELLNVNTAGSLRILQQAVPRMRAAGGGRIILLSSLWGRLSGPMVSHYAASKHAIEAIVDAARREFGPWNIDLVLVEPGVVATAMVSRQAAAAEERSAALAGEEARHYGPLYRNYAKLLPTAYAKSSSAEAVAVRIGRIVEARRVKPRYAVGTDAHAMIALAALLPARWLDGLFRSQLPVVDK